MPNKKIQNDKINASEVKNILRKKISDAWMVKEELPKPDFDIEDIMK